MSASGAAPHPIPLARRASPPCLCPGRSVPPEAALRPRPPAPGRPRPAEPAVQRGLGTGLREPPPAAARRASVRRGSGALTLLTRKPSLSTPSSMSPRAPAGPAGAPGALSPRLSRLSRLPRPLRPGSASEAARAAPPWPAARARGRGASRAGSHARSGFLTRLPPRRCARVRGWASGTESASSRRPALPSPPGALPAPRSPTGRGAPSRCPPRARRLWRWGRRPSSPARSLHQLPAGPPVVLTELNGIFKNSESSPSSVEMQVGDWMEWNPSRNFILASGKERAKFPFVKKRS